VKSTPDGNLCILVYPGANAQLLHFPVLISNPISEPPEQKLSTEFPALPTRTIPLRRCTSLLKSNEVIRNVFTDEGLNLKVN